jgi:transcriptional regulator with XRE-family HTH domain
MKHAALFHQIMQDAFERAAAMRMQEGHKSLSLRKIAEETGIEVSVLSRLSRGISRPDGENLFQLLIYLGCNETERRWIFHLAELATPEETRQTVERCMQSTPVIQALQSQGKQARNRKDYVEVKRR